MNYNLSIKILVETSLDIQAYYRSGKLNELVFKTKYATKEKNGKDKILFVHVVTRIHDSYSIVDAQWIEEGKKPSFRIDGALKEINQDELDLIQEYVLHGTIPDLNLCLYDIREESEKNLEIIKKSLTEYQKDDFFSVEKLSLKSIREYKNTKCYFVNDGKNGEWYKLPFFEEKLIPCVINDELFYIHSDEGRSPGFLCLYFSNGKVSTDEYSLGYIRFEEIDMTQKQINDNTLEELNDGTLSL